MIYSQPPLSYRKISLLEEQSITTEFMETYQPMALKITAMAALLVLFACHGEATKYTVGDTKHWTLGVNYTAWASDKTFHLGDTLDFIYSAAFHNVLEVNQSAYSSCLTSNPLKVYTGGSTNISLTSVGTKYYICGIPGHCPEGMKVAVTVSPTNPSAPSPSPTNPFAPYPSAGTAPEPTSAGNVSQMKDVLVLLFGSLVMWVILA